MPQTLQSEWTVSESDMVLGRYGSLLTLKAGEEGVALAPVPSAARRHITGRSQLDLTPEIEVFCFLFNRFLPFFTMPSLKQRIEYFNFRRLIHLDHLYDLLVTKRLLGQIHHQPFLSLNTG